MCQQVERALTHQNQTPFTLHRTDTDRISVVPLCVNRNWWPIIVANSFPSQPRSFQNTTPLQRPITQYATKKSQIREKGTDSSPTREEIVIIEEREKKNRKIEIKDMHAWRRKRFILKELKMGHYLQCLAFHVSFSPLETQ